ncbi:arylesterase [Halobacteriovorax marinus]|uniref:Arylesterase n=1 Tax=Halobacteriovorax marinus TaxID=97084 RepID=A0A1Y5F980_9BACT|nr:arylesterase [Halobacteriovorax marinus]
MKLILILTISLFSLNSFSKTKILFLGDSLTEGYGIAKEKAYPSIVKRNLKDNENIEIDIINGSVSGSTTASATSRLKWFLRANPSILVLALGANDGLRGINLDSSKANLSKTITLAKKKGLKVVLAGMYIPPNYGVDYTLKFKKMYQELHKKFNVVLIPFLLEGVAANSKLNQSDGIHPNELGHELMAKNILKYLRPLL